MKIISYNINGVRSAISKGLVDWISDYKADIVCFQETKAQDDQIDKAAFEALGYEVYSFSAQKKGYSGVAILTKLKPKHVEYGMGNELYDSEGRTLRLDFENFSILNSYHPSGSSGDLRQEFKMKWLGDFQVYINQLKEQFPNLVISGDFNICHKEIDINNPKKHTKSSGFLPEERQWMSGFIESGFVDSFRKFYPNTPDRYSWWSYRAGSRGKNLGWRIDYHFVSQAIEHKMTHADIFPMVSQSDHCPILLELNL